MLPLCNKEVNGEHIFPTWQLEPLLVEISLWNPWLLSLRYALAVADAIFGNRPS